MRKKCIVGNWKMNKTPQEAMQLARAIKMKSTDLRKAEIGVCPPAICISAVADILKDTRILVGAQNLYLNKSGAFTGEISAPMIKDAGCSLVIIGHSERRQYFHETDELVNRKIGFAMDEGLRPIVCIGETLDEREQGKMESVIERQFTGAMKGIPESRARGIIIAYEPVWAIGTGKTATVQQADEVHRLIRQFAERLYSSALADALIIQYGGSVKPDNAAELFGSPNIDGALIGGASLDADGFIAIARAAEQVS